MDLELEADRLLERIGVIRDPCDLDLLIFLARHPHTLMASEQLSAFLGYGAKKIAASLDLLVGAGCLTRTPNPAHAARLYVLSAQGPCGEWLPELLRLASTRRGRLAMISAMRRRNGRPQGSASAGSSESTPPGGRPLVVLPIPKPSDRGEPRPKPKRAPGSDDQRAPEQRGSRR